MVFQGRHDVRKESRLAWGLAALALWVLVAAVPGANAAEPKTTVAEVENAIMSPVCPGKLLVACPSAEGAQLRELVRRKVEAGETKEQIVQYFVEVYGPSVLPVPPAEGFFLTAWLLPFLALLSGIGVVFVFVRAWSSSAEKKKMERSSRQKESQPQGESGDALEIRLQRELDEFNR